MMSCSTCNDYKARTRGFTLIELLLVIGLLGMMVGIVSYSSLFRQLQYGILRTESNRVAAALRRTFSYASTHGLFARMVIDLESESFWVETSEEPVFLQQKKREEGEDPSQLSEKDRERDEKRREEGKPAIKRASFKQSQFISKVKLDERVDLSGVFTPYQEDRFTKGRAYIHFFPSGFAEPAFIYIQQKKTSNGDAPLIYTLELNPLTGKIQRRVGDVDPDRNFGRPAREEAEESR